METLDMVVCLQQHQNQIRIDVIFTDADARSADRDLAEDRKGSSSKSWTNESYCATAI